MIEKREFTRHLLKWKTGEIKTAQELEISILSLREFNRWVKNVNCLDPDTKDTKGKPNKIRRKGKPIPDHLSICSKCPAINSGSGCLDFEEADAASANDTRTVRFLHD